MKTSRPIYVLVSVLVALCIVVVTAVPAAEGRHTVAMQSGFVAIDIYIDSGNTPLAAYQFEFTARGTKLVGVEGGEHAAFADAPYYDPAALADNGNPRQGERIIVAAFSTEHDLPTGRIRVARLHLQVRELHNILAREIVMMTAGDANGNEIKATVEAFRVTPGTNSDDDNEGDAR